MKVLDLITELIKNYTDPEQEVRIRDLISDEVKPIFSLDCPHNNSWFDETIEIYINPYKEGK